MKINEPQRIGAFNAYQKQNESRTTGMSRKRQTDEVQISAEAKEMLMSSKTNNSERTERIEQLKNEVSTGTYYVDARAVAEKLLPFLRP